MVEKNKDNIDYIDYVFGKVDNTMYKDYPGIKHENNGTFTIRVDIGKYILKLIDFGFATYHGDIKVTYKYFQDKIDEQFQIIDPDNKSPFRDIYYKSYLFESIVPFDLYNIFRPGVDIISFLFQFLDGKDLTLDDEKNINNYRKYLYKLFFIVLEESKSFTKKYLDIIDTTMKNMMDIDTSYIYNKTSPLYTSLITMIHPSSVDRPSFQLGMISYKGLLEHTLY
jgi:hypothetical protein